MKKYLPIITTIALLTSCSKYKVDDAGDFNVTISKNTFAVGDTVKFSFAGNPDYIIFYSGEPGKNYQYKDTRRLTPDSVILNFSTNTTALTANTQSTEVNRVSLLVSTDFSGIMDSVNIKSAVWTDISSSANWATGTATVQSGALQVAQYKQGDKPVFFAFRYVSDTIKSTWLARRWTVASFNLRSYFNGVFNPLAGGNTGVAIPFTTAGFQNASLLDKSNNWAFGNTSLTFNAPAVGTVPNEDWSISRSFDFTSYVPDLGVGIKTPSTRVEQFQYRFTVPGTYTVTFLAKNQSASALKQVTRQVTLFIQ